MKITYAAVLLMTLLPGLIAFALWAKSVNAAIRARNEARAADSDHGH